VSRGRLHASRHDGFAAGLLPIFTMVLLALVTVMPVKIPGYAAVTPLFVLMGAYHWTVYRPDLLPPVALFVLGCVVDLLAGAPLGVSSLVLLVVRTAVMRQRKFFVGRLFPFVWAGFALAAGAAAALQWALGCAINAGLFDPRSALLQWVLSVGAYPVVSWILMRLQRWSLATWEARA